MKTRSKAKRQITPVVPLPSKRAVPLQIQGISSTKELTASELVVYLLQATQGIRT